LATVTGSPCETVILGRFNNPDVKNVNYDKLWGKLLHSRDRGFLMCAMCSNNSIDKEEFENLGLLNIHAYSLQDIKEANGHRLLRLRNPWGGTYRWLGDWSDDSPLWLTNPELRSELLREKRSKKDGVFWMPFSSFIKYFECVDICKLRPDWYEVRDSANFYPEISTIKNQKQHQKGSSSPTVSEHSEPIKATPSITTNKKLMQAYYLTLTNITELDITLYRKISKNLRIQRSEVSLCVAIVSMEQTPVYRIYSIPIISNRGQHKFVSTDGYLEPGTYVILPLLFNPDNKQLDTTEFTIAVHSSRSIDLKRISLPIRIHREFLIKLCLFFGEQVTTSNSKHLPKNQQQQEDGITIYELKKFWDGLVLLVENKRQTKYVHFHFRCTLTQNALISRQENHELYDSIPPLHRQIIVTISRKNASHSFTIGHDFQYILSNDSHIKHSQNGKKYDHYPRINMDNDEDIHVPQQISARGIQHD
ncbi:unnamed protein product, partial [Didymodactylos carnosus]